MTTMSKEEWKKQEKATATSSLKDLGIRLTELEVKIAALEKQVDVRETNLQQYLTLGDLITRLNGATIEKPKVRKIREYTDEERKAIRERLEAGKLAKQKIRKSPEPIAIRQDKK